MDVGFSGVVGKAEYVIERAFLIDPEQKHFPELVPVFADLGLSVPVHVSDEALAADAAVEVEIGNVCIEVAGMFCSATCSSLSCNGVPDGPTFEADGPIVRWAASYPSRV